MAAWAEIESLWQQTAAPGQRLAKIEAAELAVYLEAMDLRQKRGRGVRNATLGLLLVLGLGLTGGVWLNKPHLWQDLAADYVSQRGERRQMTLTDGSTILLDADSAINVDITADRRRVELLRGAASFRVSHSAVPFRVRFGEGEVTVHGTVFDIQLLQGGGLVVLQEGSVAVSYPGMDGPRMLTPGDQFVRSGAQLPPQVSQVEISDATGWRDGRFVFEMMRFGDLIATLERYSAGRLVIASDMLAERRVSGSLDLDTPEAALQSLRDTVGFTVTSLPGPVLLLRP
ncbi:FecR family protein [Gemmobacter serpentinus]|uniref:FecR family protein n=1 Tax=Gemmobacter serpentinus TaxID=2652247 RepID=UPI001CF6E516|nr:FecR domain-containing protein [Gemmobacter serpentinus]